jgi:hypothetical protein
LAVILSQTACPVGAITAHVIETAFRPINRSWQRKFPVLVQPDTTRQPLLAEHRARFVPNWVGSGILSIDSDSMTS